MSFFTKKPRPISNASYPPSEYCPVIRSSICTGERTACMQNLKTGKLTELMLIKSDEDVAIFCREYGLKPGDIKTVY